MGLMRGVCIQMALQAVLAYASRIDEKGLLIAFSYQSTRAVYMPIIGLNLRFLTCGRLDDGMLDKRGCFRGSYL